MLISYKLTTGFIQTITVPGDKSISHRGVILASLALGDSEIDNFLMSKDCLATVKVLKELGALITFKNDKLLIKGCGKYNLKKPLEDLNCQNSGTLMRLLLGLLAAQAFTARVTGDASLCKRPMLRVIAPLKQMGAQFVGELAPITVLANSTLSTISYDMPVASAQVKSCLLLAALYCKDGIVIKQSQRTRDHSEIMLKNIGYPITYNNNKIQLGFSEIINPFKLVVPGDFSSAAFFLVAALLCQNSSITIKKVGINPTRTGLLDVLRRMGALITISKQHIINGELVADLKAQSSKLYATKVSALEIPDLIDEIPILAVAAAYASGDTLIHGIAELRFKESDRVSYIVNNLKKLMISASQNLDTLKISGGTIASGVVDSGGDHRIAMAFAIAGLVSKSKIFIKDCKNIDTSFPNFINIAKHCGLKIEVAYECTDNNN